MTGELEVMAAAWKALGKANHAHAKARKELEYRDFLLHDPQSGLSVRIPGQKLRSALLADVKRTEKAKLRAKQVYAEAKARWDVAHGSKLNR